MAKVKKIEVVSEETNYKIKDVKIEQLVPNVIQDFLVSIYEDHHTIILPSHTAGLQFKTWLKGRGGIFSKDVLNYTLKKPHGKYAILKGHGENCIIRLISEEEELSFKTLNLIDGQIKDRPYMILRQLNNEQELTSTKKYISENETEHADDTMIIDTRNATQDDDFEHHAGSISLFNE